MIFEDSARKIRFTKVFLIIFSPFAFIAVLNIFLGQADRILMAAICIIISLCIAFFVWKSNNNPKKQSKVQIFEDYILVNGLDNYKGSSSLGAYKGYESLRLIFEDITEVKVQKNVLVIGLKNNKNIALINLSNMEEVARLINEKLSNIR